MTELLTTTEPTVEEALKELREMFPGSAMQIRADSFPDGTDLAFGEAGKPCTVVVITVRGGDLKTPHWCNGPTLSECMAQIRAWKEQEK